MSSHTSFALRHSVLTRVVLAAAFLFASVLAGAPLLHQAWHGHHTHQDGEPCLACLLHNGAAESAPALLSAVDPALHAPRTHRAPPDELCTPARDVPKYLLEHAPPSAS